MTPRSTMTVSPIATLVALGLVLAAPLATAAPKLPPAAPLPAAARKLPLEPVVDVPLGGHATRLDYLSFDPGRHLLFIAHLGDSAVIVFDTEARRVVKRITGVGKVHGVLAIPELGRVYASATASDEVVAIDVTTLDIVARIPGGRYPDGMAYAPAARKLYVSDQFGDGDTVVDVDANRVVATIPLGGEVGNTQYDAASGHVYANVQTRHRIAEIDPATDRVVATIDLPGADGNHGLLIEPNGRRAFVVCEGNDKLLVVDLAHRKLTATFPVGHEPDVVAYDSRGGLLYVASESGAVSMFRVEPDAVTAVATAPLGPNAHVVGVDPASRLAYFPLMDVGGRTELRIMRPTP